MHLDQSVEHKIINNADFKLHPVTVMQVLS